jgi:hypothetical protein
MCIWTHFIPPIAIWAGHTSVLSIFQPYMVSLLSGVGKVVDLCKSTLFNMVLTEPFFKLKLNRIKS